MQTLIASWARSFAVRNNGTNHACNWRLWSATIRPQIPACTILSRTYTGIWAVQETRNSRFARPNEFSRDNPPGLTRAKQIRFRGSSKRIRRQVYRTREQRGQILLCGYDLLPHSAFHLAANPLHRFQI